MRFSKIGIFLFLTFFTLNCFSQSTIFSEFFDSGSTPWGFFSNSSGITYTGNSASGDRPATSPFYVSTDKGYGINSGTAVLTSNNINTSSYSSADLSIRLAAFSISSTTNGMDAGDIVTVEISPNGGTNWYSTLRVLGNSNAYWSYSGGTGVASTAYDGNASPVDFAPAGGGNRTTDGYSTITISSIPISSNMKLRITLLDNSTGELWVIDDVKVTGVLSSSPVITHTGTSPSSTNILQSSTNNLLYAVKVDVATSAASLTQVVASSAGTWVNGDLSNFKLYYSSDAVWDGADVLLKTITNPTPGTQTFASLSQSIPIGTKYLLYTCDVAAGATLSNSVSLSSSADANFTYSNSPTFSGSSFASANAMTIIGPEIQLQYPAGNTDVACGFTLGFGSVIVNQTSSLTFRIKNVGTSDLNITTLPLTITGTNANQFSITTQPTSPITAGSFQDVVVQFAPTSGGAKTASISIANNDGTENPCSVTLTGTGNPPAITHTGTAPASTNISQSSTTNILYKIQVDVATLATTLTQVAASTSGSWVNGDISNFKLWFSTDGILDGGDVLLKTLTNPVIGTQTFGSLSQSVSIGTQYLFITCDVAAAGIIGHTVSAGCTADANLTYGITPNFSGSSFATANLMTIIGPEIQLQYPGTTSVACGFTLPFGNVQLNQMSSLTFKITNTGTTDLNLTSLPLNITGTNADQFNITTQPTSPITAGSSVDVIVQFAPTTTGAKTASISIANNDGNENPCSVNLTGTGTSVPAITHTGTSPSSVNIAQSSISNVLYKIQVDVASSATTLTQVVATTGGTWVNGDITNFKLWYSTDATFGGDAVLSTLTNPSPGADITFGSLTQAIPTGTKYLFITCDVSATATIGNTVSAYTDLDSDLSYNNNPTFSNSSFASANLMTIIGVPELQLEYPIGTNMACSGTIPFGSIVVGQTTSLTFRIKNTGTADLNLTTLPLTIGGTNANQFSITTQPTSPVSAGSFVDVVVQFAPSSTGAKTANISIANNDSDENPCAVNLTGTGTLANDNCSGAIALSVSGSPTCGGATSGTTVNATDSGLGGILCSSLTGTADDDVWYSFVAASTSHIITVVGTSPLDAVVDLRSGACNGTNISCADLTAGGGTETLTATGLSIGATYFVRIYGYGSGASTQGAFTICVTTPPPPYYFRSKASGLWSAASTWEVSTDNMNWSDATSAPTSTDLNVNIRSPHVITLNSAVTLDQTTVEAGSTLEVSNSLTILDGSADDLIVYGILKNTDGSFTTTGTISIENGGKYQHNPTTGGGTLPTCTWKSGSTCEIIKASASPGSSLNQSYYNFIWNSSNHGSSTINLTNNLKTINGDFSILLTGTAALRLASSGNTLNVGGKVTIANAATLDLGNGTGTSIVNITGNLEISGGTLNLMGAGNSSIGTVNLKGNLVMSGGSITELTGTSGTSTLVFNGTSPQTASFGTISNQVKIEINCTPGVSLGSSLTLVSTQDLKLTSGYLQLNNFNLDMSVATTTISGGSASSFIITNGTGVLKRVVGGSNVLFPIGNSNFNPLILANSGTSDVFSASVIDAVLTNGTSGTEYTDNVVDRTWIITEITPGGSNVTATFQWAESDELSGFDRTLCFTGHYNNGWQNGSAGPATGSNPYTRTRTGITSFSPFAVGSFGALPVELVNFNAIANKKQVDLSWTTASEKNNDRFEIERSEDADSFDFIASIKGAGNSFLTNNYSFTDLYPINGISYYRLKQFDFDGEYSYSPIRSVNMVSGLDVNIFPTVSKSEFKLSFGGPLKTDATIDLIAVGSGNIVYSLNIPSETISEMIPVSNIPSGSYFIRINNGQELISKMFIKID